MHTASTRPPDEVMVCLTNMLCFLEEITKWIDVGSPVDIIYLDFQKADKVPLIAT